MPKILSGEDYLALPVPSVSWLVNPVLPAGGTMLIYGDPKVGKSYAALQLCECLTSGASWLGFPTTRARVVYLQLDTPRILWRDRIVKLRAKGLMQTLPFIADRESLEAWPFNILNPEHLIMLREELQALKPDMVVVDTLREAHTADENDSTEMQGAIAALVAATQPAALTLISHSRKPNQDDGFSLMNDNRGSSYVVGRMDAIVRFTPKSCRISGRAIEEHSLELEREDEGFWSVVVGEHDGELLRVLQDASHPTIRAKAKVLSARVNKSESACRGLLRRYCAAHPQAFRGQ